MAGGRVDSERNLTAIGGLPGLPASKPSLRRALTYLENHAARVEDFGDVEDFAVAVSEQRRRRTTCIGVNLTMVRTEVARALWSGDVFLSLFSIDQVIYSRFATSLTRY